MAFNEKLNKFTEETQKTKPFIYGIVFRDNTTFRKQNNLLQVKLKALLMEEKDVNLWWDVVQDIVQEDIGKVCKNYERTERLYKHKISQMEKVMPSFEYEPLVLSLKPQTLDDEEDRGDTYGASSSRIRVVEELGDLIGGKDSLDREVAEQIFK